jgi:hypothetical protein
MLADDMAAAPRKVFLMDMMPFPELQAFYLVGAISLYDEAENRNGYIYRK